MSRRVRTVLKVTGAAVAVLALAVACWIEANNDDISPPDTSDLVPDAIQVAVEDNAYTHFRAAFKSLDWPKNDRDVDSMCYGETWDDGFVIDLLARNRAGPGLAESRPVLYQLRVVQDIGSRQAPSILAIAQNIQAHGAQGFAGVSGRPNRPGMGNLFRFVPFRLVHRDAPAGGHRAPSGPQRP